jgi:hypothetical protein
MSSVSNGEHWPRTLAPPRSGTYRPQSASHRAVNPNATAAMAEAMKKASEETMFEIPAGYREVPANTPG